MAALVYGGSAVSVPYDQDANNMKVKKPIRLKANAAVQI